MAKKPQTSTRKKWLLAAASTAVALSLVAVLELALAALGVGEVDGDQDPFFDFEAVTGLYQKVETPRGEIYRTRPSKVGIFNVQEFPAAKATGAYRIFALGGSTTFGRPYDWRVAFPHWLEQLLRASQTGRDIEVINAGGVSYASYRVVVLMAELLGYEPDLFVVYTGHNEFLEERVYGDRLRENALLKMTRRGLSGLRTVRWLRSLVAGPPQAELTGQQRLAAEVETRLDVWDGMNAFTRDEELRRDVVDHYRWNVTAMVRMARDRGIPIVFVAPASNVRGFSPFKSEHREDLEPGPREAFDAALDTARASLSEGRAAQALAMLQPLLAVDDAFADLHYQLGVAHMALGQSAAAEAAFRRARDEDVCPLRAPRAVEETLRSVTAEMDIPLVDLPALLAARSQQERGHAALGNDEFLDHVHLSVEVHQLLGQALAETIAKRGWLRPQHTPSAAEREQIHARVLSTLDPRDYALKDLKLAKVLGWAGKYAEATEALLRSRELLAGNAEMHYNLGVLYARQARPTDALAEYERALATEPEHYLAQFHAGRALAELDRHADAAEAFRRASRIDPGHAECHYRLALSAWQSRSLDLALQALDTVARLDADYIGQDLLRGRVLLDQGRDADALVALERSAARVPDAPDVQYTLGVARLRAGDLAGAEHAIDVALTLQPDSAVALRVRAEIYERQGRPVETADAPAEVHFARGVRYQSEKRWPEAIRAYAQALESDPEHARACNNLGAVWIQLRDLDKAIGAFSRAIAIDQDDANAHYNLAQLKLAQGDRAGARRHLARAEELGIEPSDALRAALGR